MPRRHFAGPATGIFIRILPARFADRAGNLFELFHVRR
jgi:hypothetical protein